MLGRFAKVLSRFTSVPLINLPTSVYPVLTKKGLLIDVWNAILVLGWSILGSKNFKSLPVSLDWLNFNLHIFDCFTSWLASTTNFHGENWLLNTKVWWLLACEQAHLFGRGATTESCREELGEEKWACTQAIDFLIPCVRWRTQWSDWFKLAGYRNQYDLSAFHITQTVCRLCSRSD